MNASVENDIKPDVSQLQGKIGWLCQSIRWLIVVWLVWNFYTVYGGLLSPEATAKEWNAYWGLAEGTVTTTKVFLNRAIVTLTYGSTVIVGYAVWQLMSGYLSSDIFSPAAARRLRFVGLAGIFSALIDVAVRPFLVGVLSVENYSKVAWYDWASPQDLLYLLIALFILALAYIQGTAAAINDENKQFV
jgi:Protein of unknown function (DUF2975)